METEEDEQGSGLFRLKRSGGALSEQNCFKALNGRRLGFASGGVRAECRPKRPAQARGAWGDPSAFFVQVSGSGLSAEESLWRERCGEQEQLHIMKGNGPGD